MRAMKLIAAGIVGAGICAVTAARREPSVSMHELDWWDGVGDTTARRYRSPGHLLHHLSELASLSLPLAEVYAFRALSPTFREQIMIVTAMADECPQ